MTRAAQGASKVRAGAYRGLSRVGVDTGGTFTDVVLVPDQAEARPGNILVAKVPSTPDDPSQAVRAGLDALGHPEEGLEVIHGTTVALNALLTGSIPPTALVTNEGFRDLIEIGRQDRPDLYALHPSKPVPLVPRHLRFEINQRSWPGPRTGKDRPENATSDAGQGQLQHITTPRAADWRRIRDQLAASDARSVAICLLHSWAEPSIEVDAVRHLRDLGIPITCSADILPEYREHERFSTAVVNAALVPVMGAYLERLAKTLTGPRLSILQSCGGTLPARRAAEEPVRVLLSGPAGGVIGAARAAEEAGLLGGRHPGILTLDMGGTSTDVAFHSDGSAGGDLTHAVTSTHVAGHPVAVPSLDIHTIGCGGGSLVTVDSGGILRVGPESAGADPGPICHGHGKLPTVTDAHVLLGHIAEGPFLRGACPLDMDAVARAFESLGRRLGVAPDEAARGVLAVARAAMRRAVGVMSMQRGQDPRGLPLVAFGGAGGLHAAALAESLGMPGALVPALPGVLSARGMASAHALRDHSLGIVAPLTAWGPRRRSAARKGLADRGRQELVEAGHPSSRVRIESSLDLRYRGQSYEIAIPEGPNREEAFHRRHELLYGWRLDDREVDLVNLRVRALVPTVTPRAAVVRARRLPPGAILGHRVARFGSRLRTLLIAREQLLPGHHFEGPAAVEEFSGTTLIPPGWKARVTACGHLWMES